MSNAQRQGAAKPNPPVDFIWKDDEETGDVTIVDFRNGTAPEVVIPNEIGRLPVTKIENRAFGGLRNCRLFFLGLLFVKKNIGFFRRIYLK